jgi:predicted RNase H-like HicB family nuclease
MSNGETREEVARNIEEANACWIDEAAETGREVPSPSKALKVAI